MKRWWSPLFYIPFAVCKIFTIVSNNQRPFPSVTSTRHPSLYCQLGCHLHLLFIYFIPHVLLPTMITMHAITRTHLTASLLLCPLGLRRLLFSSSLYLNNPSLFRSRTWYLSESKWKNLDIYSLLILLPIASFSHIVFFLAFSETPTHKFSFLQQSVVVSFFWAILVLIYVKESFDLFSVPDNLVFAFAAIAFLIDFYMTGSALVGIGGWVYRILGYLTVLCAACCVHLSVRPGAFFAEFLLSCGLVLKGSWVMQVGLLLYSDAFSLKGCGKIGRGEADVKCELDDDVWRGVALIYLVFVGHVVVVMVISFVSFGLLHSVKRGEGSVQGSESMLMHQLPEIEIE